MGFIGRTFDFINGCKIAERPESTVNRHRCVLPTVLERLTFIYDDGETPRLPADVNLLKRRRHGDT